MVLSNRRRWLLLEEIAAKRVQLLPLVERQMAGEKLGREDAEAAWTLRCEIIKMKAKLGRASQANGQAKSIPKRKQKKPKSGPKRWTSGRVSGGVGLYGLGPSVKRWS